jgi:hypothetical protein
MFIIHIGKENRSGLMGMWRDIPSGSLSFSEPSEFPGSVPQHYEQRGRTEAQKISEKCGRAG